LQKERQDESDISRKILTAGSAKNDMAKTEKHDATILPIHVRGTVSPYPIVVTVIYKQLIDECNKAISTRNTYVRVYQHWQSSVHCEHDSTTASDELRVFMAQNEFCKPHSDKLSLFQ